MTPTKSLKSSARGRRDRSGSRQVHASSYAWFVTDLQDRCMCERSGSWQVHFTQVSVCGSWEVYKTDVRVRDLVRDKFTEWMCVVRDKLTRQMYVWESRGRLLGLQGLIRRDLLHYRAVGNANNTEQNQKNRMHSQKSPSDSQKTPVEFKKRPGS